MTAEDHFYLTGDDSAFGWLKGASLQRLFSLLNRDGEEVRVVGGAVRNALIGVPVADIDCATTAEPSLVMDWARAAGIRVLPTGLDHGTVTLLIDDDAFEVTTLRTDVETDGRHAQVVFGRDWAGDAQRRDFTMNALYLDAAGRLYDPTGQGLEDAKAGCVRFVGEPGRRIAEDYLRVLRFFRFHAHYGKQFSDEDYRACIAAQGKLGTLSAERVGAEMMKLLVGPFAMDALQSMYAGGILQVLLGSVPHLGRLRRLISLTSPSRPKPNLTLRLACLAVVVREDAYTIAGKWRLTNRMRDRMVLLANEVGCIHSAAEEELQRLCYIYGKRAAINLVLLALVERQISPNLTALSMMLHNLEYWEPPVFPVNGRDLIDRGIRPGPMLGERLNALEEIWVASGFQMSKSELLTQKNLHA